jgi:hypothetical protein
MNPQDYLGETEAVIHEQMEPQAQRIKEYGSVGRYKNYGDVQTGVGGKGRTEKPLPGLNEQDIA